MLPILYVSSAAVYGVAGALFLTQLAGSSRRPAAWGPRLLMVAAVLHASHDLLRWALHGVGPFAGIREALSTLALFVVTGFLVLHFLQRRIDVVGAFVTPLTLLMLLASGSAATAPSAHLHGALVALHVASTLLATAAFTVAFAMAVAYLLQERQVKRKRLAGLFRRLPPLEVLDDVGYRCVAVGLPALTLGIVTGLFVGARSQGLMVWQQYVGMAAWLLFAGVLVLRLAAGWRGRRAAIGTILGYASAVVVLLGYYLRGGAP